jgi:hypothetical protein
MSESLFGEDSPEIKMQRVQWGINGRGLHSFTFPLNVSAFCGVGGSFRDCLWGIYGVLGGIRRC